MRWAAEEVSHITCFDQMTTIENRNFVTDAVDTAQVMRNEERRQTKVLLELRDQFENMPLDRHVESRDSLVVDHKLRL
ncbi:hypothetical protein CQ10_32725 [Bradyrhizobium valentinum]|nr:hypothetical protein CQ10_32725 [Bradyrhizobium valentinum]